MYSFSERYFFPLAILPMGRAEGHNPEGFLKLGVYHKGLHFNLFSKFILYKREFSNRLSGLYKIK